MSPKKLRCVTLLFQCFSRYYRPTEQKLTDKSVAPEVERGQGGEVPETPRDDS